MVSNLSNIYINLLKFGFDPWALNYSSAKGAKGLRIECFDSQGFNPWGLNYSSAKCAEGLKNECFDSQETGVLKDPA